MSDVSSDRRRQHSLLVGKWGMPMLAILGPVVAFGISSGGDWFFDWGGADNWQFLKHFLGWTDSSQAVQDMELADYKGARVGWVAFGWFFFSVFPSAIAQILLTTATFVAGQAALYFILREVSNRRIALVVVAIASAYPALHSSSGGATFWNYHGSFANSTFLIGVAAFMVVRANAWRIASVASGSAFAVALSTTFALASLGLGMLAMVGFAIWRRPDVPWLKAFGLMLGGFVLALAVLGLLNWAAGGDLFFYLAQFDFTSRVIGNNPWWVPWDQWFPKAFYMGFVTGTNALAVIGIAAWPFVGKNLDRERRIAILFAFVFGLLCTLGQLVLELSGQNILSTSYIAYHLVAPGFAIIAAALCLVDGARASTRLPTLVMVSAVVLIMVLSQILIDTEARKGILNTIIAATSFVPASAAPLSLGLVTLATVLLACASTRFGASWAVLAVGMSLLALSSQTQAMQYAWSERKCGAALEQSPVIVSFVDWTTRLNHPGVFSTAWMSSDDTFEWIPGCPVWTEGFMATLTYAAKFDRLPEAPGSAPTISNIAKKVESNYRRIILFTRPDKADTTYDEFVAHVAKDAPGVLVRKGERQSFVADEGRILTATVVLLDPKQ